MSRHLKHPSDVLDYVVTLADWLPTGDAVDSATVTVSAITGDAAPLVLGTKTVTTALVRQWVSGGTAGYEYTLTYTIVTQDGRTVVRKKTIVLSDTPIVTVPLKVGEVLDFTHDFADWLAVDAPDDTIASRSAAAEAGLTVNSTSFTASSITAWLTSAAAGRYRVTYQGVTTEGRTKNTPMIVVVSAP